jgi:hypothetical protein
LIFMSDGLKIGDVLCSMPGAHMMDSIDVLDDRSIDLIGRVQLFHSHDNGLSQETWTETKKVTFQLICAIRDQRERKSSLSS